MASRKEYEAVAQAIAHEVERNGGEPNGVEVVLASVAGSMARWFAQDNPRFDRERFLQACKVGG